MKLAIATAAVLAAIAAAAHGNTYTYMCRVGDKSYPVKVTTCWPFRCFALWSLSVRLFTTLLSKHLRVVFETMIGLKIILLITGAALAVRFGPFHDGDSWRAIVTGMVLVAAMAVQNAVHRIISEARRHRR
jgi:uncharacterized membrane protein YoaK (UPF0700 family)